MRGTLAVRVDDGDTSRHVTRAVRGLRFTKSAPGGHMAASMRLNLPRDTFRDLGPADRVYIYDTRTARTVWEGYTENPGASDGAAGQEWDLAAMGGMVLASDEAQATVYVDQAFDRWKRGVNAAIAASATTEQGTNPTTGAPALHLQFNPGQPVTTGSFAEMIYDVRDLGITLGSIHVPNFQSGLTSTEYQFRYAFEDGAWVEWSVSTDPRASGRIVTIDAPTLTPGFVILRMIRTGGATNVATDTVWTSLADVIVRGQDVDRYGARRTYTADDRTHVRADQVAEDVLGRLLGVCDPAASLIETTTYPIDQLAYLDGAKAQQILDDLILYEPDFLWEILDSTGAGHRFNFRKWPTTARYEISVRDGYEAPGGEVDLCNRIAVFWEDRKGDKRATVVTSTVPELGTRVRDAEPISLPEGLGSTANATRIGQQILATKASPPKAARATVRRPIRDMLTGVLVMPWEIEPGYVVSVRETGDELRLTEMEYDDDTAAATLTLGEPTRTLEQLVAGLGGKR